MTWAPPSINIPGEEGTPDLDIMSTFALEFEHRSPGPEAASLKLPPSVYPPEWDHRNQVSDVIIRAAKNQANTVLIRARSKKVPDRHKEFKLELICTYGKGYYKNKTDKDNAPTSLGEPHNSYAEGVRKDRMVNKKKAERGKGVPWVGKRLERSSTTKPEQKDRCLFSITLKLLPGSYWRIAYTTKNKGVHNCTHLEKRELTIRSDRLTQDEQNIGSSAMKYAGAGAAQNMVSDFSGHTLSRQQLTGVRQKLDYDGTSKNASSATKLMQYLRCEADAGHKRYKALYHEVTQSTLHTVKKARKSKAFKEKAKKSKELEQSDDDNSAAAREQSEINNNDADDNEDSADADILKSLASITLSLEMCSPGPEGSPEEKTPIDLSTDLDKLALGITLAELSKELCVGQKILLAVAWCREDERQLFEMFPEVLMFDVTYGTNTEARPLGVSASTNANMEVFTPFRVFMPSECMWVFDWIIGSAIPDLLGKEPLRRVQLFLTDGDPKIYRSFDKHQSELMPNARHGLCVYHLVTKGLEKLKPELCGMIKRNVIDQIATFKHWVFTWMAIDGCESDEEFDISRSSLRSWLRQQFASTDPNIASNAKLLDLFLTQKVLFHKDRWFFPLRAHLMTLGQKTTSALEGVNQTIKKKSSKVVTPAMTLLESLKTQDIQCKSRMDQYHRAAMRQYTTRPLWSSTPTAPHVVKICESQIQQNYEQHEHYYCKVISPAEVHMIRRPTSKPYCGDCSESVACGKCSKQSPIVRFKRRRKITFTKCHHTGRYTVRCSCHYQSPVFLSLPKYFWNSLQTCMQATTTTKRTYLCSLVDIVCCIVWPTKL